MNWKGEMRRVIFFRRISVNTLIPFYPEPTNKFGRITHVGNGGEAKN